MRKIVSLTAMLLLFFTMAIAQSKGVTGKVTDQNGDPLPFASISVKGGKGNAVAGSDGTFSINAKPNDVLVVSAINYQTKEVAVGTDKVLSISLTKVVANLTEVVVTTAFNIKKDARTTPFSAQVIKSDALNIIPQTSLNDALVGKVAGVQFRTQSGSKLNSSASARIRGGLLLSGDVAPIYVVDGTIIGDAFDIDPNDVESITVLKGANATALFGARASNGAIVVTTKRPANGKSSVEISQGVTFDQVGRLMKLQNRYGGGANNYFTTYHWKAGDPEEWKALDGKSFPDYTDDSSWGPAFDGEDYAPWYAWVPGTKYSGKTAKWVSQPNNVRDFFNTGVTTNTGISLSRGGQGYSVRLNYSKQNISGIIPDSKLDRNVIGSVMNFDVNKFITAGINFTYNTTRIDGLQAFNDGYANQTSGNFGQWNHRDLDMGIMKELRNLRTPINTLASWNWAHNPDGYDASNPSGFFTGNYWYNFYSYLDNISSISRKDRFYGDAHITVNVTNNFKITGTVRQDFFGYYSEGISKSILESSGSQTGFKASYSTGEQYHNEQNYELVASYNKTFFKDLNVNVLAGGNIRTAIDKNNYANTVNGLNIADYYAINNSKSQASVSNYRGELKTNSFFGSGDFEYKKFVSATWALRQDWSSTLPTSNNKLFYPSAGFAFIPSEFTKTALPWLSFAKVYGSWGRKPLSLDVYQTNLAYSVGANQWNGNFLMSSPTTVPDKNLHGSLITTYEAGIELRFLKNKLGVNFNYYDETASDQPITINVGSTSGVASKVINAATVKRHGIELAVNATIVSKRDFTWNVTKTFGWLIANPVTKIIEGQDKIQPSGWGGAFGSNYAMAYQQVNQDWGQLIGGGFTKAANGQPLIDPTTGAYVAGDVNKHWGSVVPKVTGGLQNLFTYKNVILNLSIDYQFGGNFFSLSESWAAYSGLSDYTAATNDRGKNVRDALANGGGVHVTGVSSVDQKTPVDMYVDAFTYYHNFYNQKIAEPFVHKLSYVKLREISIGYNLPVGKWNFTQKWAKGITVSAVARNPWLIYSATRNFDPSEISNVYGEDGQLPPVKSYGFNVKFSF